jgi:alkyl sulfatase BDS1-like metallo-beta-lactamase superfamily hydrolase
MPAHLGDGRSVTDLDWTAVADMSYVACLVGNRTFSGNGDRPATAVIYTHSHGDHFGGVRGAVVRNPHVWARYLTETIELFGGQTDVLFASHHWPTWGQQQIKTFLTQQRDLYAYLHDQTARSGKRAAGSRAGREVSAPR